MTFNIKFCGIDRWNRPTFVTLEPQGVIYYNQYKSGEYLYFCDTDHLFDYNATEQQILDWYSDDAIKSSGIIYKGRSFESEPQGGHYDYQIQGLPFTPDDYKKALERWNAISINKED